MTNELLKIIIQAQDDASKQLKGVSNELKGLGDNGNGVTDALAAAGKAVVGIGLAAGVAAVAFTGLSVKMAVDFQKTIRETSSNLDLTTAQTAQLSDAIKGVMMVSPAPMKDIAEAYRTAGSEGFSLAQSTQLITEANKAAIVTGDTVSHVTGAVAIAMHDYGANANETAKYLGYMHGAMVGGNMTMDQLTPVMGTLASTTKLTGVNFREAMGSMAMMTSNGIDASEAVTSINQALLHLEVPTKQARNAMDDLAHTTGIDVYEDFQKVRQGSMSLQDALKDVEKATGGNVTTMKEIMPEIRGLKFLMVDGASGGKLMADSLAKVDQGQNALADSYSATQDNLDILTKVGMNNLNVMMIEVGTAILPMLIQGVQWATKAFQDHRGEIQEVIKKVGEFVKTSFEDLKVAFNWVKDEIPKVTQKFQEWADWYNQNKDWIINLAGFLGGIATGFALVYGAVAIFNGIMLLATGAMALFGIAMVIVTSPIFLVALAIGAVIGVGFLLWKNWGFVTQQLSLAWNWLVGVFNSGLNSIVDFFAPALQLIQNVWNTVINWLASSWQDKLNSIAYAFGFMAGLTVVEFIKFINFIQSLWDSFTNFLISAMVNTFNFLLSLPSKINQIWNDIVNFGKNAWDNFTKFIWDKDVEMYNAIVNNFNNIKNFISDAFNSLKNINLYDIGRNIIEGLMNGLKNKWNDLKNLANQLGDSIQKGFKDALNIHSPSKVMMEIGDYTMQGLNLGMQKGQAPINTTSQQIANSIVSPYKNGGTNQNINNVSNNNSKGGDLIINMPNQPILLSNQSLTDFFKQAKQVAKQQGFQIA